jgi:hypothetical protein
MCKSIPTVERMKQFKQECTDVIRFWDRRACGTLLAELLAGGGSGKIRQMIGQFTLLFVALPGIYTAYHGNIKAQKANFS